jgi:hypothetical protein
MSLVLAPLFDDWFDAPSLIGFVLLLSSSSLCCVFLPDYWYPLVWQRFVYAAWMPLADPVF